MTTVPRGRDRLVTRCGQCGDWRYLAICRTCLTATEREMRMTYGPNTIIPERHEAERDEHEAAQARGECTFANPCPACERSWKR
jgi:hypothetical protein